MTVISDGLISDGLWTIITIQGCKIIRLEQRVFPITLANLASELDGRWMNPNAGNMAADDFTSVDFRVDERVCRSASIDSRTLKSGGIFFAMDGTNTRGVHFVAAALQAGAACVVIGEDDVKRLDTQSLDGWQRGSAILVVKSTRNALQKLAVWNRRQSTAQVVAVTGSVGKTTTRRMVHAVLSQLGACVQSPANFNNHLGVPLSLLEVSAEHRFAVLELGASAVGEIAELAELAQPHVGVVTRVAAAHLDGFGSLEGVQRGKSELVQAVAESGLVILNGDDPLVRSMASLTRAKVMQVGEAMDCHVRADDVQFNHGMLSFSVNGQRLEVAASGRHLLISALTAVAVGLHFQGDMAAIVAGLKAFQLEPGRGQLLTVDGYTLIDDTYNASPASVAAAIASLVAWNTGGRRVLVLGDMLALGESSDQLHHHIGEQLGRSNVDLIFLLGQQGACVRAGFENVASLSSGRIADFGDNVASLIETLKAELHDGDVVLIKGSRGLQMERIVSSLMSPENR